MIKKTILGILLLIVLSCPKVNADQNISANKIKEAIVKQSIELGIDPALGLSIAKHESKFTHESKSRHGAVGVFQLMPSTAKKLGVNPYYMEENVKGGLMYYQALYKMFGNTELALAAYNAGPGNVRKYNKKVPPFAETKKFIKNIMMEYNYQKKYPDPVIAKVKHANIKKTKPLPEKLPDTTKPIVLDDIILPTQEQQPNISEQNLI